LGFGGRGLVDYKIRFDFDGRGGGKGARTHPKLVVFPAADICARHFFVGRNSVTPRNLLLFDGIVAAAARGAIRLSECCCLQQIDYLREAADVTSARSARVFGGFRAKSRRCAMRRGFERPAAMIPRRAMRAAVCARALAASG